MPSLVTGFVLKAVGVKSKVNVSCLPSISAAIKYPASFVKLLTLVGLLRICASPLTAFQSAFTFTSAPAAIPLNFNFSSLV